MVHRVFEFSLFPLLFFFFFLIIVKEFVKCHPTPEPDDVMSISAVDGPECCIVLLLKMIYVKKICFVSQEYHYSV